VVEPELVLTSETDFDYLYDKLAEEQKQFRVYAGTDISSELTFMDNGVTPDSANLDAQGGSIVKALLESREGDLKFYKLSGWNVWKVDVNGAPKSIFAASNSSLLSKAATTNNFKQSAYLINNGTGTSPEVSCQKPILELVWSCLDYPIPVYDAEGNDTGVTITVNAENYNSILFPNAEADAWKLVYAGTECQLNAASEIWTNETNGIRTIGRDFNEAQAKLQAVVSQTVLQEGTAEFMQPDWYEGQPMAAPVVSSETNGIEHITYFYKVAGADDSTYTTTVPDKAGAYTAIAVFAATEVYQQVIKTADFRILPVEVILQEGTAEFAQPDWYEGQPKPAPIVSSETNGVEHITYYYKEAGADDSTYTNIEPGKAGAYTAIAVFAATEVYQQVIKTADFQILPIVPVLQEGTAEFVQSGWYEGQPKPAPVVSSETNGVEHITYYYKEAGADDSTYTAVVPDKAGKYTAKAVFAATEVYQEVIRTSDFEILPNIPAEEVDGTAPVISGVANGQTYYGDQTVTVTDENLSTVTVNGEAVEVINNCANIVLHPAEDVYKIAAADKAGNKTELTVEVLETWVRDGIITNGKKKLRRERIYKLGSGQWTVDGDSTIYSGGGTFYVKNGGEYDFKRK
ncbi:MAG: hypothetical protein K2N90_11975, partial [Lachnospiraceae bacterium]|nr:hypothetical protein [Lachnospiraceae bacterium]